MLQAHRQPALLALGTADNGVSIHDVRGKCVSTDRIRSLSSKHEICGLEWHPSELVLACAWSNGAVQLALLSPSGRLQQQRACTGSVECTPTLITWTPDGGTLLVGYTDGSLRFWRNRDAKQASELAWTQVCSQARCSADFKLQTPPPGSSRPSRFSVLYPAVSSLRCMPEIHASQYRALLQQLLVTSFCVTFRDPLAR